MRNPVLNADFPDPDVIRVEDTYYMVCTTKHFMPGGIVLRSYDLEHWEICSYLFDKLESTPAQRMCGEQSRYGYGMEGGSIRYHKGKYYATFYEKENDYTYLFVADNPEGPWEKRRINQVYYFNSLFFDDDDRVYMIYGYRSIYLQELKPDLSGPLEGTASKVLITDTEDAYVNFTGVHFQKINGLYYIFVMKWPKKLPGLRTQYCFYSDRIDGGYTGKMVLCTDMGYHNQGVAQCSLVDSPDGKWYAMLYQDRGAIGRLPILVPVTFQDNLPVFGVKGDMRAPFSVESTRPDYVYEPLYCSDKFTRSGNTEKCKMLKKQWQWNHEPDNSLWWLRDKGGLCIRTDKISTNLIQARNTLTQRCIFPKSEARVTIHGQMLKEGDYAGLCVMQGCYGFIGITRELNRYYLVVISRELKDYPMGDVVPDYLPGTCQEKFLLDSPQATVGITTDFEDMEDTAQFYYQIGERRMEPVGKPHRMYFKVDHFTGAHYGLSVYSTKEAGGYACFTDFTYLDMSD